MSSQLINKYGLFVWADAIPLIDSGKITAFLRTITSSKVDNTRLYTRIGHEGDLWYILETGKLISDDTYIRKDGSAAYHANHTTIEVVPPQSYNSIEDRFLVKAQDMPIWAARYWCKIMAVSYPIRVQDLTETQILALGIEEIAPNQYKYANDIYTATSIKEAFKTHWNAYYGKWKQVKGPNGAFFASYPYDEEGVKKPNFITKQARGVDFITDHNPYITYYQFEKLEQ